MKIIETDNFGQEYPDEKFLNLPLMTERNAKAVCTAVNSACSGPEHPRFWVVVKDDYKLRPGFSFALPPKEAQKWKRYESK